MQLEPTDPTCSLYCSFNQSIVLDNRVGMRWDDAPFEPNGRNMGVLLGSLVVGTLANAAGMGGGALYVPLFNIVIGLALKSSVALSQAVIAAASVVSVALKMTGTHALDPRLPLIDYEVALVVSPVLFVGVSVGVLLNVILPECIITIILLALLTLLGALAVVNAVTRWKQDTRSLAARSLTQPLITSICQSSNTPPDPAISVSQTQGQGSASVTLPLVSNQLLSRISSISVVTSVTSLCSEWLKRCVSSKSLSTYLLGASEGLDFSVNSSNSLFAASTLAQSDRLVSDLGMVAEESGAELNRGGDAAAGVISPRHSSIAGGSDPGRARLIEASLPPSPKSASHSAGMTHKAAVSSAGQGQPNLSLGPRGQSTAHDPPPTTHGSTDPVQAMVQTTSYKPPPSSLLQSRKIPKDVASTSTASVTEEVTKVDAGLVTTNEREPIPPPQQQATVEAVIPSKACIPVYAHVPWGKFWQLVGVWAVYVGLQLWMARVGKCTHAYWGIFSAQLGLMLLAGVVYTVRGRRRGRSAQWSVDARSDLPSQADLISSQPAVYSFSCSSVKQVSLYWVVVLMAGLITSLLGTGTGTVVGPFFLLVGMTPDVSSATASVTVLMASSAALVQYAVNGEVNLVFALIFGGAGIVSAVLASLFVYFFGKRMQRASVITIVMAAVIVGGALSVYISGLKPAVEALKSHDWEWGNVCSSRESV